MTRRTTRRNNSLGTVLKVLLGAFAIWFAFSFIEICILNSTVHNVQPNLSDLNLFILMTR